MRMSPHQVINHKFFSQELEAKIQKNQKVYKKIKKIQKQGVFGGEKSSAIFPLNSKTAKEIATKTKQQDSATLSLSGISAKTSKVF